LHRTGGYWIWSDGLYTLSQELREHHSGERVSVLDWGFANGLYVKSAGAIDFVELFWSATERGPGDGRRWEEVVAAGGLFVRAAPGRASIATQGFERALAASGQAALRQEIRDRGGQLLAEIVVVSADRARPTSRSGASGQGARNP
jgi:hypothetical protein